MSLSLDEQVAKAVKVIRWLTTDVVRVRLYSEAGEPAMTEPDRITGALVVIPVVHHEVHEGETFQASYKTPDASPIADNGNLDILIRNGDKYLHFVWSVASGGEAEQAFYIVTAVSNNGTALTPNNMKEGGPPSSITGVSHTPTVTVGAIRHNSLIPGGTTPQSRSGGSIRDDTEWILSPNTNYLVRGTNRAGNAQQMSITTQWYEESDN